MANKIRVKFPKLCFYLLMTIAITSCLQQHKAVKKVKIEIEINIPNYLRSLSSNPSDSSLNIALIHTINQTQDTNLEFTSRFIRLLKHENPGRSLSSVFPSVAGIEQKRTDQLVETELENLVHQAIEMTVAIITERLKAFGASNLRVVVNHQKESVSANFDLAKDTTQLRWYIETPGTFKIFEAYTHVNFFPYLEVANNVLGKQLLLEARKRISETIKSSDGHSDTPNVNILLTKADSVKEETRFANPILDLIPHYHKLEDGSCIGIVPMQDTALFFKYIHCESATCHFPSDVKILPAWTEAGDTDVLIYAIKADKSIDGSALSQISAEISKNTHKPCISMYWDRTAALKWNRMTSHKTGTYIAFFLDGAIISCPIIKDTIDDGGSEIEFYKLDVAKMISGLMKMGRTPLTTKVKEVHLLN